MRKLIHSDFELDLSGLELSDNEENNWFSDSFFTKYSFPFEIDLDKEMDMITNYISQHNSSAIKTYFDVMYVHANKFEKAILEIEGYQDKLRCILRYGFEQLPSFEKQLSELTLDKFELQAGVTIFSHAQSIITKKWPEVNYNFPQVHIDKYNPDDELWKGFEQILNNRVSGVFLENTVDTVEDITYNRNVMQPMPYALHILQRIMIDAGYELAGDILNDQRLQKACVYGDVDYFKLPIFADPIEVKQIVSDAFSVVDNRALYKSTVTLPNKGKYNVSGRIRVLARSVFLSYFTIKYNNTILYNKISLGPGDGITNQYVIYYKDIDLDFETIVGTDSDVITIETYQPFTIKESINVVIDLSYNLIRVNNSEGFAIPTIVNQNAIDLTRSVPNKTVAEFVKDIKNWFNYDLTISGKFATMNLIETKINSDDAIDLQFTEVERPEIKYNQGISFLLKFQDIESKDFKFLPVFHDRDGAVNSNYKTNEKTTTIEVAALPLPLFTRNGVQTAYLFENNDSKTYFVIYDGIYNGNNYSQPIDNYLIPAVHETNWKEWFKFRINSRPYLWDFKAFSEKIYMLTTKSKIYAYNKFHVIKTLNRTEVEPDLFDFEIETETLE